MTATASEEFIAKLDAFAERLTAEQQAALRRRNLACQSNLDNAIAHWHLGAKYARMDVGTSGKYMIELDTERIYGIKAYGVIHRGHAYGTLDTLDLYHWGGYAAILKGQ